MRHEKTVSVRKIKPLWEPWEEDETPRNFKPKVLKYHLGRSGGKLRAAIHVG